MPPKLSCPCIQCKKNVVKAYAVGCASCGQWVHKECEELSDEIFNILAKKTGGIKWHCQSCEASTARLEAAIKSVEIHLNTVEERMGATEEKTKLVEAKADNAVLVAEQAGRAAAGVKEDVTRIVFEELSEREDKKHNIILHNVGESASPNLVDTKKWDEDSFNNVTAAMGVNLTFQESASFSRRLGAGGGERARPLLIGLKKEEYKVAILSCASKLATSRLSSVSVVPDLTKKQREMDEEVRREADRRNREELTDDDRSKNLRWVAVGRKGARKIIKKVFTERVPNSHLPNSTRPTSGSNSIIISQNRKRQASGDQPRVAKKKQKKKTAGGEVQPAVEDQLAENAQQESEEEYLEVEESEVEEDEMEEENI